MLLVVAIVGLPFLGGEDAIRDPGQKRESLPTSAQLDFQFAHAQARDAVHLPFDHAGLSHQLAVKAYEEATSAKGS